MTPPPSDDATPGRRRTALVLSWIAYATYYLGRKGFSAIKKPMALELGLGSSALGAIDTAFLVAYALGQLPSGLVGDRLGSRRLVGYGMLVSALACAAFGCASGALAFGLCFLVNGLAQATGWPGTTRVVAEWTTPKTRGTVMGVWATCYQVGGLVATPLAGLLAARFGWRSAMLVPALLLAFVGLVVLLRLPSAAAAAVAPAPAVRLRLRAAQLGVVKSPTLWCFGLSYFFIKLVRYALLFWLPFYLSTVEHYGTAKAAGVSIALDAGGIVGVILVGRLADRGRLSAPALSVLSICALVPVLGLYARIAPGSTVVDALALALIGALLFAPDSLLSGVAAQNAADAEAAATATGFVNGLGSVGAALQGLIVPRIAERSDWRALFPALALFALFAIVALLPTLRRRPALA